jgi:hypothetical protein
MAGISDSDKMGMAALIASTEGEQTVNRKKKGKPINTIQIRRDIDANENADLEKMLRGYTKKANGGRIDGVAMKGRTRGKMC